MPPDIVIRSSGVWDSRSPFHQFLERHKKLNRSYSLAVLLALKIQREFEGNDATSVRPYFNPRKGSSRIANPRESAAWKSYKLALGRDRTTGDFRSPSVSDIILDAEGIVSAVRSSTLTTEVALFESYLQCWSLNYLLDKLEKTETWTNEERYIASKLSPLHSAEPEPSAAFILRCLPTLQAFLRSVPAFFHDKTGAAIEKPDPPEFNGLTVVKFWIALRNTLVHHNGWVSSAFASKYAHVWELQFQSMSHIGTLKSGVRVNLYHEIVACCVRNLYRVSLALSDHLESLSKGRRGQPWAPEPREMHAPAKFTSPKPRPLLIEGDHELSLKWASDEGFRRLFVIDNLP